MAAPTFQLSETNTSSTTVTDNVPQISLASVDSASTSGLSAANPIAVGNNSFEKYNRLKVTGVAPNSLSAFGIYFSATAPTDGGGSSSFITPKYGVASSYATPTASSSSVATTSCSATTAAPGTTFTAPANTLNAYSEYTVQQLQTTSSASGGNVSFPSPWTNYGYTWS